MERTVEATGERAERAGREHETSGHLLALPPLESRVDELAAQFRSASPFPHLVLEDVLALDPAAAAHFPAESWPHWARHTDDYQRDKASCSELLRIPSPWRDLISELSAPGFLRFLERVTGIEKLIPDPHLQGGGLHRTGPGGHLSPHTDFHVYADLDLYRRINVLVYLNPDWEPGRGGELSLYDARKLSEPVTVPPVWGRCVIFATDDRSVHGVNPVAEAFARRSIALYYYTAAETGTFAGDRSTHWRTHGDRSGVRGLRVAAYQGLMMLSRLFSIAAHLVNPNFGMRAMRERIDRGRASGEAPR